MSVPHVDCCRCTIATHSSAGNVLVFLLKAVSYASKTHAYKHMTQPQKDKKCLSEGQWVTVEQLPMHVVTAVAYHLLENAQCARLHSSSAYSDTLQQLLHLPY